MFKRFFHYLNKWVFKNKHHYCGKCDEYIFWDSYIYYCNRCDQTYCKSCCDYFLNQKGEQSNYTLIKPGESYNQGRWCPFHKKRPETFNFVRIDFRGKRRFRMKLLRESIISHSKIYN
jgi:hypothetical protein